MAQHGSARRQPFPNLARNGDKCRVAPCLSTAYRIRPKDWERIEAGGLLGMGMTGTAPSPKSVSFFARGRSRWQFEKNEDGLGLKAGVVAYQSGTLALLDKDGNRFRFTYRGVGGAWGVEIHLPMRIPHADWLLVKLSGITKVVRKKINRVTELISGASDAGGGNVADKMNDQLPDWIHPSRGIVFCGPGCGAEDLSPEDFEGWCIFCNVDSGLIFGTSGIGMIVGLREVRHSWPTEFVLDVMPSGWAIKMEEAVSNAKALILFAGANFDFRAGGGAAAMIGYVSRANEAPVPSGDILQFQRELLSPTLTKDGREIA